MKQAIQTIDTQQANILPKIEPEMAGISSWDLLSFIQACQTSDIEFHHLSLARQGKLIFQCSWSPYRRNDPHMIHSLTKLFTNTAIGLLADQKLCTLDDSVLSFFPDEYTAGTDEKLARMTLRDLLTMRTGHGRMISGNEWRPIKTSWIAEFFKEPVVYPPGEHFQYTSAASYMLSAVVQKITGMTTAEYLQHNVFSKLGVQNLTWDQCPNGINSGGNGISLRNEDILKIGILYLQNGVYGGEQILSSEWTQLAMIKSCLYNPQNQYGFHFTNQGDLISSGGIFGQTLVLIPEHELVLAFNSANQTNHPHALDPRMATLIRESLLPAVKIPSLAPDPQAVTMLDQYARRLTIPIQDKPSPTIPRTDFSGNYSCADNEDGVTSLSFKFQDDLCLFSLCDSEGTHSITCGHDNWIYGTSTMTGHYLHHQYQPEEARYAAYGYWLNDRTYIMKWAWINMTFVDTCYCHFVDNRVRFKRFVNVNTQQKERPMYIGIN